MKRRKKWIPYPLGIKHKFGIFITVVLLFQGVFLGWHFVREIRNSMTDSLERRGYSLARSLSRQSSFAVYAEDTVELKRYLQGLLSEEDVIYGAFSKPDGGILVSIDGRKETLVSFSELLNQVQESGKVLTLFSNDGDSEFYAFCLPVNIRRETYDDFEGWGEAENLEASGAENQMEQLYRKVGYVHVGISLDSTKEKIASEIHTTITLAAFIGSLAILFSLVFSRRITEPIGKMVLTAKRIAEGDYSQTIKYRSGDEIGELADAFRKMQLNLDHIAEQALEIAGGKLDRHLNIPGDLPWAFNKMIDGLRESRDQIENHRLHLRQKVEERTKELKKAADELTRKNVELERANKLKSEFLATMSHELRTPLNAVIGFSEVLMDQVFGAVNDKQLRYLENIKKSGRHLLKLINDILDLSKIEAGKVPLKVERFYVPTAVEEVCSAIRGLADKKGHSFYIEIDKEVDAITADKGKFFQIMFNILSNAIKFTPKGGEVWVNVSYTGGEKDANGQDIMEPDSYLLVSIRDTGIGIHDADREKVFEKFQQIDGSYTRSQEGIGLGLALTKKLVELHGGRIWFESEAGKGTTFFFTLPTVILGLKDTDIEYVGTGDTGQFRAVEFPGNRKAGQKNGSPLQEKR